MIFLLLFLYEVKAQSNDTLKYVFFGHIYQWGDQTKVDYRIENMDLSQFDRIWLGGDVCSEASLDYSTLSHLNDLFDLDKPGNHWTLGNHDARNGNIEWITSFTKRPTYYSYSENNITTMVMDGNLSPLDCENLNKQFKIIKNVCDTINSGRLIVLVHHGIYNNVPGVANPSSYGHSLLKNWISNCYDDTATYLKSIYPMLVSVKNRGIDVIQIMGDVGANPNAKSYYGISNDGVEYFGSGINNTYNMLLGIPITSPDLILIFKHVLSTNELFWDFVDLDSF
ncbi:MAG: hypothetical protein HYU68_03630 [Bacteroidetes bacterium]|nr:hypothetical protein [Bacteroidota bacterium]